MGNRATRKLAGELQKKYGFSKNYAFGADNVIDTNLEAKAIISFLSLKYGQVVYDFVDKQNHIAVGVLWEQIPKWGWQVQSLVYSLGGCGSAACVERWQLNINIPLATSEDDLDQVVNFISRPEWFKVIKLQD